MADLTAQTTFQVGEPQEVLTETLDLTLLPENTGINALRELHYPLNALPPIIYDQNPEWWDNFDTGPLTARPLFKAEMTLADVALARWPGYVKDRPVKEYWRGDDKTSHMTLEMLRQLWEYFANPPASGYIEWWPKDRTPRGYYIEIESVSVGGSDGISLNLFACLNDVVLKEVELSFRIISEILV
jgi:hypothetical protein